MKSYSGRATTTAQRPERQTPPGASSTYFNIECSVCGRQLRALVEQFGQQVACGHCRCRFQAMDPALKGAAAPPSSLELADRLLARLASIPSPMIG